MQAQQDEVTFVRVIDPRVDVNKMNNRQYAILDGPSENSFLQSISTSFSNNTINFSACNPPNGLTFVSRYVPIEVRFEINFVGVSGGAGIPLLQVPGMRAAPGVSTGNGAFDSLRAFPLMNATNSIQIKIGDATISQNINQFFRNFTHYYNFNKNRTTWESTTPCQLDPSFDYQNTFGTIQNPMNSAYDSPDGVECPRGGFVDALLVSNTSTGVADTAQVIVTVREPVLVSPFLPNGADAMNSVSYIGVETLSMIISLGGRGVGPLSGLFGALWSHNLASPSTITSGSVNVLGAELKFQYMTPDGTQLIPSVNNYSYSDPVLYPTSVFQTLNPGQSTTILQNNIQLGSIPDIMYISVQEADQYFNCNKTDTFLTIENLNITFDNRSALLSTMTPIDLYNMNVKNGSIQSWRQFSYDQGSIIAVSFGSDLALGSVLAPGVVGNFSLNMKVQCRNQTNAVLQGVTLNVIVISSGVMSISQNRVFRTLGPLSRSDVLNSKSGAIVPYHHPTNFYGGGFLDSLKKAFGSIAPWLRRGLDVGAKIIPQIAPQYAPMLGVASDALRLTGNGLVGGRRRRRGGEMISKNQLLELMD